ncbi:MAG: chloroperoxidase [Candidatus Binatia bacterium]
MRRWNDIALDANAVDHARSVPDEPEQLGPVRTARAFAIVHIAIFDAVNAIAGGYRGYAGPRQVAEPTSIQAAVAQAAHDTLVALFPSQATSFDMLLAEDLSRIRNGHAKGNGIDLGRRAAAAILALRASDGSQHDEELYVTEYPLAVGADKWRQDPISEIPLALGSRWGELVAPFVLTSATQFPIPPPPAAGSREFIAAFDEVKNYGGCGNDPAACAVESDGFTTPTMRTPDQAQIGIYWGYDGTPGLGTPPRLYNQIAVQIAEHKGSSGVELARLLALINVAMADAGLAAWNAKYDYEFCRPITAIRAAGFDTWTPLGAPASNKIGPNFTPPFPAYASGHATFGAALFQILRKFYGTDRIRFTFVSDEFNGATKDNTVAPRERISRSFRSLSHAEEENGQSRIYLGIHWAFDKTAGIEQGRRVVDYVMKNVFTPVRGR